MGASLLQDDRKARRVGIALISVSLALLCLSIAFMAKRLASHNREDPPTPFAMVVAETPEFEYQGVPFALTEADGPPAQMLVEWGDAAVRLPIGGSVIGGLPLLVAHADWISVLLIAEGATELDGIERQIASGLVPARLVVVARQPAPEYQQYKDHVYTFLELKTDGSIERTENTYREIAADTSS